MSILGAWQARALGRAARSAAKLGSAARLSAIANSSAADLVDWARGQAAQEGSAGRRATMLAKLAASLAVGGRAADAVSLVGEAIRYARLADRQTFLEIVPDVATVLESAGDTAALIAMANELLHLSTLAEVSE